MTTTPAVRDVAGNLQFPEGPVARPDGTALVVEIRRGSLSRVGTDGKVEVVADLGGGPNGAAIGPDGACYVVNNGGFSWSKGRRAHNSPRPRDALERAAELHGRLGRAGRPRHGRPHRALPGVRRLPVPQPERHRLRRCGRVLVHRPRQDAGARHGQGRPLLRARRRVVRQVRRAWPARRERRRALAQRRPRVRRRELHRSALGVGHRRARPCEGRWRRPRRRALPRRDEGALRFPGGRGGWDGRRRRDHRRPLRHPTRLQRRVRHPAGRVHHEHLLRGRRPPHRARHAVGRRPPRGDGVAAPGLALAYA